MTQDEIIKTIIAPAGAAHGAGRSHLLQYLVRIQHRLSYIPAAAVTQLATLLQMPEAEIHGVIGFYTFLHEQARGDYDILLSDSITDHMLGSRMLLQQLCNRLGIGYVAAMLRWPAGPRPEDGVWARWWYASVHESTGFRPGAAAPAALPEAVAHLLDPCLAIYGKLSTYAVSHED